MSEAILLLRLEHRHADELLRVIEQQLSIEQGPDLDLLRDVAAYFRDYPDTCHHPVEDRVYRKLEERDPGLAADLGQLLEEHAYMEDMTVAFAEAIEKARRGEPVAGESLADTARHFVKRYRAHMGAEEEQFFPAALETLTDDDWAEIEFDLFDRDDPLFESQTEKKYMDLRAHIARQAVKSRRRATVLRMIGRLRRIESVAAFNEMMERRGEAARLVARPGGGFGLEMDGQAIIDIPRCSPGRAAWCAYYYLQMPRFAGDAGY